MKKLLLLLLLSTVTLLSFSQFRKTDKQIQEDKKYIVTVGTSKNTASYGTTDGFTIKENNIRIVGFLHRGDRIEHKEVYIETKRDGVVIDSQTLSCTGVHVKWRDFYLKFTDVVYSNNYITTVYVNADKTVVLGSKAFFIKKDQE